MSEPHPHLPPEILQSETAAICQRYRIEPAVARQIIAETFASRPALLQKILATHPRQDVTRLSDYKAAIKQARQRVYYHLRQYHRDHTQETLLKQRLSHLVRSSAPPDQLQPVITELLRAHISTQERLDHYGAFYHTLFSILPPPRTIIDIGCGLHPLSYPFTTAGQQSELYLAIDKDPQAIQLVAAFAPTATPAHLLPLVSDIGLLNWQHCLVDGLYPYDLAFMLKLIPVIARQQKALLPLLAAIPARRILLTASATAMTRDEAITRREDHVLQQFIKMTGRPVLHTFSITNEFGYLLGE